MSKIEKAVEKAKQKRHTAQKEEQIQTPVESPIGVPLYTQTKTVSPDKRHLEKHRVIPFLDNPTLIDRYNILRTQILKRTRDKGHNTIMITSVLDGEGKTITAINMAVSIAREVKQTVLLVDADLRNPKIDKYLGCNVEKGLSDYLQTDAPVSNLLVNPKLAKMVVLPGGRPIADSTEFLGSPKMEKLVKEMKTRYPDRYVLFNCPPLLSIADSIVFSSYVDGVILVVEAGRTPKSQIRKAVELLEGRNIVGLVLNKAEVRDLAYSPR
jgi:exopolysaccharide/PEP-CTERM locus tyrosine autokinase